MFASYLIFSFHYFMPTDYFYVEVNLFAVLSYHVALIDEQVRCQFINDTYSKTTNRIHENC